LGAFGYEEILRFSAEFPAQVLIADALLPLPQPMSQLGQSLPKSGARPMSAFHSIATELQTSPEVRFVPIADTVR
jgi:hypothetical protein